MRMYKVYVCECCGKGSLSHDAIEVCEAAHMGLTVEEKHNWDGGETHFGRVEICCKVFWKYLVNHQQ